MDQLEKEKRNHQKQNLHAMAIEKFLNDEIKTSKQKELLESLENEENEILNRTIFVTNIKDIRVGSNLKALQTFFERNFGPVEKCYITSFQSKTKRSHNLRNNSSGPPPPAKVTFRSVQSAIKIFGMPLDKARNGGSNSAMKLISANGVAYNGKRNAGKLKVYPAEKKIKKIPIKEEDVDGLSKTLQVSSISLGHWIPEDIGLQFLKGTRNEIENYDDDYEFLEEYSGFQGSQIKLDLRQRLIQIRVTIPLSGSFLFDLFNEQFHTITFRLKNLDTYLDLAYDEESNNHCLVFGCKEPPKLYQVEVFNELGYCYEKSTRLTGLQDAPFERCFGFKIYCDQTQLKKLFNSHDKFHYRLQDFGIIRAECLGDFITLKTKKISYGLKERNDMAHGITSIQNEKLRFMIQSVLDKGRILSWYHALKDHDSCSGENLNMFELVRTAKCDNAYSALEFLREMNGATKYPCLVLRDLMVAERQKVVEYPSYCVELPRIMVTPTRVAVVGFDVETSNRVVREFIRQGYFETDFLRASFCDENGNRLTNDDFKSQYVEGKISQFLLSPFSINGNQYRFLAYSSSQLKEASVWLVNCSKNQSLVSEIRRWMGDFKDIKIPSKYAARMGQCLSTTIETLPGTNYRSEDRVFEHLLVDDTIDDICSTTSTGKQSCHSDGTGLIRKDVLQRILEVIPSVKQDLNDISVIQIRIGGAKGTLTAWNNHPSLRFKDVCLRPSMIKFPASYNNLEVVKVGRHVPYYLNRQMIMLLGVHKVPMKSFLEMQQTMLDDLDSMLINREKAQTILQGLGGLDSGMKEILLKMLNSGFCPKSDPFLFSCLHALRTQHLMNLKKKSRIFVAKGAVLIGGLDESGEVPEGCVFVQLRSSKTKEFAPLKGPVLIAKHPVTHPGDVRMLLAVDVPNLNEQKNVLLFSKHGLRAEADKMSGSDLDGDEFAVTWDERLFLNEWNGCKMMREGIYSSKCGRKQLSAMRNDHSDLESANQQPMEFDTQGSAEVVDEVTDEHLVKHFVKFGASDSLGRIAMLWLDHAAKQKSASCQECLKLAELHSVAVDYPKSGVPAVIPTDLIIPSSAPRPHWRERKVGQPYHCDSVIGQLYDQIVICKEGNKFFHYHAAVAGRNFNKKGQLLCFTTKSGWLHCKSVYKNEVVVKLNLISSNLVEFKEMISFSLEQKRLYEDSLVSLMNKYKIYSEGELITGCILKFHKLNKRRQHKLAEEVRRQSRQLYIDCRNDFLKKVISFLIPLESILEVEMPYYLEWTNTAIATPFSSMKSQIHHISKEAAKNDVFLVFGSSDIPKCREIGQKLAAAYYVVMYYHTMRELEDEASIEMAKMIQRIIDVDSIKTDHSKCNHSLFSFPYIVYDVISLAFLETFE